MRNKRVYDIKIALERLKNFCTLQDRCQFDVIQKMKEWGLLELTQDHILELLITDKYIDEERYAQSFCRGKFRIKNWGKRKITNELKRKQISTICINIGLKEIDENVKIIFLSGHNEQDQIEACKNLNGEFIIKPISSSILYQALGKVISA